MSQPTQTFANHARLHPPYHFVASPLALVYVVWSAVRLVRTPGADTLHALVGALALFAALAFARLYAMKVQDRVIRLEERLRLARVLPADLQPRIEELTERQLIALRFASDAEVADLVREVLANPAIPQKAIKQRVRQWRPDHFRV
jgi:hypothetical protein